MKNLTKLNEETYIITFDLLTGKEYEQKLRDEQNISLSSMYDIIKRHMQNNNFYWQQGSTYISNNKITNRDFRKTIDSLYKQNSWLSEYTRDMTNGIIKDVNLLDFKNIINKYKKQSNEQKKSKQKHTQNNSTKYSP